MIHTPLAGKGTTIDFEAFRLRNFVEGLRARNELDDIAQPVDLADLASHLDGNPKAVLFRAAGPERAQIAGNVVASRRRLALGLGVSAEALLPEVVKRCRAAGAAGRGDERGGAGPSSHPHGRRGRLHEIAGAFAARR